MAWQRKSKRRTQLPGNWTTLRRDVLKDNEGVCSQPGCNNRSTEVHHTGSATDHRRHMLRPICKPCHNVETQKQAQAARAERQKMLRRPTRGKHPGEL